MLASVIEPPEGNAVAHKIHIRGVDDLTTDDLKAFAAEHHSIDVPIRVEWIDDTSANLVYNTPAAAMGALQSFSFASFGQEAAPIPLLQLRSAKRMSNHPESNLQVRMALSTDVKRPRAHEASRFYMMHPEYDPRERARRHTKSDARHDYRRRCYDDDENRRRRLQDRERSYKASMYDDDSGSLAGGGLASRRSSISMRSNDSSAVEFHSDRRSLCRNSRHGDYYRPGTKPERRSSRTRSASPGNGKDSHLTSDRKRPRRRTPPGNRDKELFASSSGTGKLSASTRELFPNKRIAASLKKELFPAKASNPHHRRSDAFDAADETADLFATGMAFSSDNPLARKPPTRVDISFGRLRNSDPDPEYDPQDPLFDAGMKIRGASEHQDTGVSILGAAQKSHTGKTRELFPNKIGNSGKELFAERLQGRGLRTEDLFH